jgi:hypothetical protein
MAPIQRRERLLVALGRAPQQNVVPVLLRNTHLPWSGVRATQSLPCALLQFPVARKKVPARAALCGVEITVMCGWTFAVSTACQGTLPSRVAVKDRGIKQAWL